jgi:APA family basic amino acid/polyamine antiporter
VAKSSAVGELKRSLGIYSALSLVVGSVIGSGIFLVATDIAKSIANPWIAIGVWVAAAILTLLGALVYSELGAAFPGAGGPYLYLRQAFGPLVGYLYGWTLTLVIQPGSIAAVAVAFGKYLSAFIPMNNTGIMVTASLGVIGLTGVNLVGVKKGAGLMDALSSLKVIALVVLAGVGIFATGITEPTAIQEGSAPFEGMSAFGVALIAAFWAFDGWNNVTFVAGEVKDPQRNIPLSLVGGILATATLYVLVTLGYFRVLGIAEIQNSQFVAADTIRRVLGAEWAVTGIVGIVVLSTLGCVNGMILAGARVAYAMAADGSLPKFFAKIHPTYDVPSASLLFQMLWSVVLVWSGSYDQLFTYVISAAFVFYGLTGVSLIVLRGKMPKVARPYKVPLYPVLPAAYVLLCAVFVLNTFVEKPTESLIGLGIVLLGVPAYLLWRKKQ